MHSLVWTFWFIFHKSPNYDECQTQSVKCLALTWEHAQKEDSNNAPSICEFQIDFPCRLRKTTERSFWSTCTFYLTQYWPASRQKVQFGKKNGSSVGWHKVDLSTKVGYQIVTSTSRVDYYQSHNLGVRRVVMITLNVSYFKIKSIRLFLKARWWGRRYHCSRRGKRSGAGGQKSCDISGKNKKCG